MDQVVHLYGPCRSSICSMKETAQCEEYAEVPGTLLCDYCFCHRSSHAHYGFIAGTQFHSLGVPAQSAVSPGGKVGGVIPPTPSATTTSVSRLSTDMEKAALTKQERIAIFRGTLSTKASASSAGKGSKAAKRPPSPQRAMSPDSKRVQYEFDAAKARKEDRQECLLAAPPTCKETDLDTPGVFKMNGERWKPKPLDNDEVRDFLCYCFTCCRQLRSGERKMCTRCERFVFVELLIRTCSAYGGHLYARHGAAQRPRIPDV
jgi:hypothetical protein